EGSWLGLTLGPRRAAAGIRRCSGPWRAAGGPRCWSEPLATLGESLALFRVSRSASRFVGGTFDVGAHEGEQIEWGEVDAQGRHLRGEIFSVDHLGDAVVRLYERYAELLPEGADRARAAVTARSVAAYVGPIELDRLTGSVAP